MFFDKKSVEISEEDRILRLQKQTLSKLSQIKESEIDKLSSLALHFFSELLNVKKKMTFEELKNELNKKGIRLSTKEKIWKFFEDLLEAQYKENTSHELNQKLIEDFSKLISETTQVIIMGRSGRGSDIFQTILNPLSVVNYIGNLIKIKKNIKTEYDVVELFEMIKNTRSLLSKGKFSEARKLYTEIIGSYSSLPGNVKKQLYFHVNKLYEKFQHHQLSKFS